MLEYNILNYTNTYKNKKKTLIGIYFRNKENIIVIFTIVIIMLIF